MVRQSAISGTPGRAASSPGGRGTRPAIRAAVASLLLLGACESGGSGSYDDAAVDAAEGVDGSGKPGGESDDGLASAAGLRFVVAEDDVLEGVLVDATRPGETGSGPFGIASASSRGTLELLPDGRSFRYTPQADFNGTDGFEYRVGEAPPLRATIDVTPVPDAPILVDDGVPLVAERGIAFVRQIEAVDADGDTLRYEARGLPDWLSLDGVTGVLSGRPTDGDVGRVDGIALAVVDSSDRRAERDDVSLEVIASADVPVLDPARLPISLDGGERLVVELFDDDDSFEGVSITVGTVQVDGAATSLDARLDDRRLVLEAREVVSVTDTALVFALTDRFGRTREVQANVRLYPKSGSGRGTTLLGASAGPGVHLVVLGDGYRAGDQALLRSDAERLIALLAADPATSRHLGAFNIHVVESLSVDAGAQPAGATPGSHSTAFSSRYGCAGVPQLICADALAAFLAAGEDYDVDHVVMLVNDERFGGSGSSRGIAIAARGVPEVALHELGHSIAGLGDEYVDSTLVNELAPSFVEGLFPNLTAIADPAAVPWAAWIEPGVPVPGLGGGEGVGLFEGGLYRSRGVFRPTRTSRMRAYAEPLGPVNGEQWVLGIYAVNTVRDFSPKVSDVALPAGETARFSVTPFFPPDVQAIEWWLDGERVRRADDARELDITPAVGTHALRLLTRDISGAIRSAPERAEFEWNWTIAVR